jgi:antitoxin (DNA-binding transcriptional repressor) of toxin-antitoxin stability system
MAVQTVSSIVDQVADGTMNPTDAGRIIARIITRVAPARTEAERMERYYEVAIETDPNSYIHVMALYHSRRISETQITAIEKAMAGARKTSF